MAYSNERNLSYMLVVTSKAVAERTINQLQKEKYSDYIIKGLAIVDADMDRPNGQWRSSSCD